MIRMARVVAPVVVMSLALLSLTGCVVVLDGEGDGGPWGQRARFERTVELQEPMATGGTLVVSTASGSIDVTGKDTDQAAVVATIQARAGSEEEAQELANQVEIRFQESSNKLEIKAERPTRHRNRISISYVITVPRQANVDCDSASGSVKVRDLIGNVNARTASGSVEGARIKGAARLHSASGSVTGENLGGGDLDLDTASGGVRLSEAAEVGNCRVHSSSGSVHVARVQANTIRLESASGGATGEDLNCAHLNASTASGPVSVAFSPSAPNDLVADLGSASGGVNVVLPPGFAGRVDLSAISGSVRIDRPVTVQGEIGRRHVRGTIGTGAGSLSAHTASGSIDVR